MIYVSVVIGQHKDMKTVPIKEFSTMPSTGDYVSFFDRVHQVKFVVHGGTKRGNFAPVIYLDDGIAIEELEAYNDED